MTPLDTVNAPGSAADVPAGVVTVMSRGPSGALAPTVILMGKLVPDGFAAPIDCTVTPAVAPNDIAVAPIKFVPVITTGRLAVPWIAEVGLSDVTVGSAL